MGSIRCQSAALIMDCEDWKSARNFPIRATSKEYIKIEHDVSRTVIVCEQLPIEIYYKNMYLKKKAVAKNNFATA